jgi:anti-anti-sigma factor
MGFKTSLSNDKQELTITIDGRFDFNIHNEFRKSYVDLPATTRYVIDLGKATYMDSSAMGMLLLLREHAGKEKANVRLLNCSEEIRRILAISNMDKLFPLDAAAAVS